MKAEHRKELETNILADRMGRVLRGTQETPTTTIWYWVIGVCLVLLVTFLVMRWFTWTAERTAREWEAFESGDQQALLQLAQQNTQNAGKAARLQVAFEKLWVVGISKLGGQNTAEAKSNILDARDDYESLAKDCQYDPVFLAEALYGLAVIEETQAIDDDEKLKSAVTAYQRVVKDAKESGFAKLAEDRLKVLEVPAEPQKPERKKDEDLDSFKLREAEYDKLFDAREVALARVNEVKSMYKYLKVDLRPRGLPGIPGMPQPDDPQFKKFLEDFKAKHPEISGKVKPDLDVKLPEIKAPDIKVPDAKAPTTPDGKTPDPKTPATKGPDGKDKLPDIIPPPPAPIPPAPPAPGVNAPAPTTPDAKTDDKKSDKK